MNANTRVAVCCHVEDHRRVVNTLGIYLHHECPVVILSPEDAKVEITCPGVESRFAGLNGYLGQNAVDRHRGYLEALLTFPEEFFFLNESDSFCVSPQFPDYVYAEPNTVWSNLCPDDPRPQEYPEGVPQIVFWAPWFLSRGTIQAMLAAANDYRVDPGFYLTGSIDYYMAQLARMAGLPWAGFPTELVYPHEGPNVHDSVRNHGVVFIHSVKDAGIAHSLVSAHNLYARHT
jgi:hypothetical protein